MISAVVAWSARHAFIVIGVAIALSLAGETARRALSRDVIPDLADPQIGVVVEWMGHPATEVAAKVTRVLTSRLQWVPGVAAVRGSSMTGMAYVDVILGSGSELDATRAAIVARVAIARANLPDDVRVKVGPAASGTGWVFQYALVDRTSLESALTSSALRKVQDTILRPALAAIPGVAEVASVGGYAQEILVEAKADALRARAVAFSDVVSALRGAIRSNDKATTSDLENIAIAGIAGADHSLRLTDVARVRIDDDMATGLAELGGTREAVGGIVIAKRGVDPVGLIAAVRRALDREKQRLPENIRVLTVYDRAELATRVDRTMLRALAEEVAVVVFVVVFFLLHAPSGLVPLVTLPVVLFLTFGAMWLLGIPATIMSQGGIGIALGMAVDADVVALEACHRRLESVSGTPDEGSRRAAIVAAAGSFAPAILTSLVITALAFLPVFAFPGETGRLLRPLALTKTLVVAAAALVALTLAPALRDRLLRGKVIAEFGNPITRQLVRLYRPFVHFALTRPVLTLATAGLAVLSCLPLLPLLGGEFLPRVDEGDLLFMPTTLPGVTPEEAASQLRQQNVAIAAFQEVGTVFGKVGRADTATDPAPVSMIETTIRLVPTSAWPKLPRVRWYSGWAPRPVRRALGWVWPEATTETTSELVARLDRATQRPGWTSAWTAPARARMDMMSTGMRTPVGIRIVASDSERLDVLAAALRTLAKRLPGTRSAVVESLGGETSLAFEPDPEALALHHVDPDAARDIADLFITGGQVGEVDRDGIRLRVRVAPDVPLRGAADQLRDATVRAANGQPVALGLVGRTSYVSRRASVRTERGELVGFVYIDLAGRTDPVGYVARAKQALDEAVRSGDVRLRPGERIEWTGQYDLFEAGQRRLRWIIPVMAIGMLGLLYLQFRSLTEALIVFASVPFALVGSFWTLFLLDYPLSAPVWVGLLSVVGLAMQTGVVMVVYIDESFYRRVREGEVRERADIVAAHAEGTVKRLRPKLMTITTMAVGLLPLVWADGAGAEIMRRVAAPMVGGLATSALLTLEVLPVLYTIWRTRQLRKAQRTGRPLSAIVGTVPGWARL